jgi:outer membrane protein assembly factor BamB
MSMPVTQKIGKEKNMKFAKNKTNATMIALFLMLTITVSVMTCLPLPVANAADPTIITEVGIPNYAYIAVSPNPVGVGQGAWIVMQTMVLPPARAYPYEFFVTGYMLTVTHPDGTIETLGPYTADWTNYANIRYTPTDVGNYTFQFTMPEQWVNGTRPDQNRIYNYQYLAATSPKVTLTVQEEPVVSSIREAPLPTDYWQRPITAVNREWSTISGNWLTPTYNATGRFNPYTTAPDSAHILWTKPVEFGGIMGGEYDDKAYYTGYSYFPKSANAIIMYGRLYYNTVTGGGNTLTTTHCVDIRTGQEIWQQNYTITQGQILWTNTMQQSGGIPYLWSISGATWKMYDANTGDYVLSITGCTSGSVVMSPVSETGSGGDILVYILNGAKNWLAMWNSTKAIWDTSMAGLLEGEATTAQWKPPVGGKIDFKTGIQWNVTVPSYNQTKKDGSIQQQTIFQTDGDVIIARTSVSEPALYHCLIGYDAHDGHQIWFNNWTYPKMSTGYDNRVGLLSNGVFTQANVIDWYGFDAKTGKQIWGPTSAYGFDAWSAYFDQGTPAYGNTYSIGFDGMHVYDLTTGQRIWDFYADTAGLDYAGFANYPLRYSPAIADGKAYVISGAGRTDPMAKGISLYCVNASTGDRLWSILGWFGSGTALVGPGSVIADGCLVGFNNYDTQLYCFGKGRSATTVTTAPAINNPTQILISGTVTDQSPGQTCLGITAAGTPAISDASMSKWMEYLYMQQPKPTNATGVPVSIDAIDPNGNQVHLGDTHSDANGQYAFLADQSMLAAGAGIYTISATFSGSNSYFSSSAETTMAYDLPVATPEPVDVPQSAADLYFVPAIAGLFVLIIIVLALVVLLMLRKRP